MVAGKDRNHTRTPPGDLHDHAAGAAQHVAAAHRAQISADQPGAGAQADQPGRTHPPLRRGLRVRQGEEAVDLRGSDVARRSGGVVVIVRGARPRTVPVLARYHARLLAAAAFAGTGLVCGGADPGRRNLTNPLIRALDGGGGLPRLDTSRLRATWLADCAELLGLATFMHAAGISCSQRLGDLVAGLEPVAEAEAIRLLGAARR